MSTLLDRRPAGARRRMPGRQAGRLADNATCATVVDNPPSFEDAVLGAWQGLVAHRAVDCLICGARMAPRYGASGHAPVGGRCTECGTTLA